MLLRNCCWSLSLPPSDTKTAQQLLRRQVTSYTATGSGSRSARPVSTSHLGPTFRNKQTTFPLGEKYSPWKCCQVHVELPSLSRVVCCCLTCGPDWAVQLCQMSGPPLQCTSVTSRHRDNLWPSLIVAREKYILCKYFVFPVLLQYEGIFCDVRNTRRILKRNN